MCKSCRKWLRVCVRVCSETDISPMESRPLASVSRRRRTVAPQCPAHLPSPWQRRGRLPGEGHRPPAVPVSASCTSVAGQRVSRKYRRSRRHIGRKLQQREYDKLRRIVPALRAANQKRPMTRVSKVTGDIRNTPC